MLIQEQKEKSKIRQLQEEFEKFEREKNSSNSTFYKNSHLNIKIEKLHPEEEEVFVSKMMHDANRRKIKREKEQRMKFETEEKEVFTKKFTQSNYLQDPRIIKSKVCIIRK